LDAAGVWGGKWGGKTCLVTRVGHNRKYTPYMTIYGI